MISYRNAQKEDAPDIKRLLYISWCSTYTDTFTQEEIDAVTSRWHAVEFLEGQMREPDSFFLVSEESGKIVGMCNGTYKSEEQSLNINKIHVLPEYQGHGIGTELMRLAVAIFPEASSVSLEVEVKNQKAIGFYIKQGFTEAGRTEFSVEGVTIPCLVMKKEVES